MPLMRLNGLYTKDHSTTIVEQLDIVHDVDTMSSQKLRLFYEDINLPGRECLTQRFVKATI